MADKPSEQGEYHTLLLELFVEAAGRSPYRGDWPSHLYFSMICRGGFLVASINRIFKGGWQQEPYLEIDL
jgi:hypothetical protein